MPGLLSDVSKHPDCLEEDNCVALIGLPLTDLVVCTRTVRRRWLYGSGMSFAEDILCLCPQHDRLQPFTERGGVQQLFCCAVHAHWRKGSSHRGCVL